MVPWFQLASSVSQYRYRFAILAPREKRLFWFLFFRLGSSLGACLGRFLRAGIIPIIGVIFLPNAFITSSINT